MATMTVAEWMQRFYKPNRFRNVPGFNADREQRLIADRENDMREQGFALISYHDSVTGRAEYLGFIPPYVLNTESVGLTNFRYLIHNPDDPLPSGCYCKPGHCMAPKIFDAIKGSMRYQVFAVADENCDSVGERLSYFDDLEGAKYFVANSSSVARLPYGAAILDYTTGAYDFGFGFGVAVPEVEGSL